MRVKRKRFLELICSKNVDKICIFFEVICRGESILRRIPGSSFVGFTYLTDPKRNGMILPRFVTVCLKWLAKVFTGKWSVQRLLHDWDLLTTVVDTFFGEDLIFIFAKSLEKLSRLDPLFWLCLNHFSNCLKK